MNEYITIDMNLKLRCTGCTACYVVCPVGAINMEVNKEGFEYPDIDKEKCIKCGMCFKVCPVKDDLL